MENSAWLPQGYTVPKSAGNYYKLEEGINKFRILSAPIMGYEYWTVDNKPVRSQTPFEVTPTNAKLTDGKFVQKHFWAFVIWSYRDEKVMIMELTQVSIQGPIEDLVVNEDWGNPEGYDITITKKGQKLDTEYTVQPSPHKDVPVEAQKALRETKVNLAALYTGADPFEA